MQASCFCLESLRLLTGLLSSQGFELTLSGDHSLSSRPMKRVIDPVIQMGANIEVSSEVVKIEKIDLPEEKFSMTPPEGYTKMEGM